MRSITHLDVIDFLVGDGSTHPIPPTSLRLRGWYLGSRFFWGNEARWRWCGGAMPPLGPLRFRRSGRRQRRRRLDRYRMSPLRSRSSDYMSRRRLSEPIARKWSGWSFGRCSSAGRRWRRWP